MIPAEINAALEQFPVHTPPDSLYRYFKPCRLSLLRDGKLNLTPPGYFNDPFEAWASIEPENIAAEDIIRSLSAPNGIFRKTILHKRPDILRDEAAYLKKVRNVGPNSPELWSQYLESCVNAVTHTMRERLGICCFSAFDEPDFLGPTGIRHWAMYGGGHEGFCVQYSGRHPYFQNWANRKWLFPVEYLAERRLGFFRFSCG